MVDTNWLMFAGTEIVNSARTAAYAGRAGMATACTGCAELPASLGDEPYTDPVSDDAPWYDPSIVESKDFHGLVGLEITGASSGTVERSVTEFLGDGGVLGAGRQASREIEVTASMLASTQAALSYGLGWLATALQGSACHRGCTGDTLCAYAACPTRPTLPSPDDDCGHAGSVPDPDWDPIEGSPNGPGGDQLVRQLYNVAVTEGPTLEDQLELERGWVATVSFTLTAGNPWWWKPPVTVLDHMRPPDYSDVVPGYDIVGEPCPEPVNCLDDNPYCTGNNRPWPDEPFPGFDPTDTSLIDPCYPTGLFTAARSMWRVPTAAMPEWSSTVPVFELHSGNLALHRITLRWYTNPRGQLPTGGIDRCRACAEMTIPWIPPRTTLTIDSRTRTTTVNCRDQGRTPSGVTVYGPRGGAYEWPAFDCATPLIAELVVLNNSVNPGMTWRVGLAARTAAI